MEVYMKKIMATLMALAVVLSFVTPSLFAQNVYSESNMGMMAWGIKGGLSLSKFTGKDASNDFTSQKYRPSGAAGAFATYRLSDMFAASLEPMWVQRGNKFDAVAEDGSTHSVSTRVDYIDVPLLAKFYVPTSSNFHPNIFVGPDVAFRLDAKEKDTNSSQSINIKDNVKSTDFGVAFGLGTVYDIGKGGVSVDGRYYAGLTKIDNTASKSTIRNGDFLFLVGYSFK